MNVHRPPSTVQAQGRAGQGAQPGDHLTRLRAKPSHVTQADDRGDTALLDLGQHRVQRDDGNTHALAPYEGQL